MSEQNNRRFSATDGPLAVIVTAISPEILAVCEHLEECHEEVDRSRNVYECGYFRSPGREWQIAVAQCGAGNTLAAIIVQAAVSYFDPSVLIFVGIAGGLKQDLKKGDVIAGNKVYCYHGGKSDGSFLERPEIALPDHGLAQRAMATAWKLSWKRRIKSPRPDCDPTAKVAPIAAGEEVVADKAQETFRRLREHYNDAHCVEMEGYGALKAAHAVGVPAIVVRGVSDMVADKSTTDSEGWQPTAAANAAAFAFEMLANLDPGLYMKRRADFPQRPDSPSMDRPSVTETASSTDQTLNDETGTGDTGQVNSLLRSFATSSTALLSWSSEVADHWIARPELRNLQERLSAPNEKPVLIAGAPGSGKSALLARFGKECQQAEIAILAIKADTLPPDVEKVGDLGKALNLPGNVVECVRLIAAEQVVVVLVDQLDALAGLVDLRGGRLNAILNLIRELRDEPNVRLVCSCRSFERNHDTRLQTLDAEVIELSSPPWESLLEVLHDVGLDSTEWPEQLREVLRVPQHLKVFLEHLSGGAEPSVLRSYHVMLDELWRREVTPFPGRSELVHELAELLAESESLWAPLARFDDRSSVLDQLVAAGILVRPASGLTVGFQHQTLFEHARARAFARGGVDLAEYVLDRQDGVFVRPLTWTSLGYLRDAAPTTYEQAFRKLIAADLRVHLRLLLLEFLGQCNAPQPFEVMWFAANLAVSKFRMAALAAARGNRGWFEVLLSGQLPAMMQWPIEECGPLITYLGEAKAFATDDCLGLIERYWLSDPTRDVLTWRTLGELKRWDDRTVEWSALILRRSAVSTREVVWRAHDMEERSDLAARLIGHVLKRDLDEVDAALATTSEPNTSVEFSLPRSNDEPWATLLESDDWHALPEIAGRSAKSFLKEVWPWFVRLLDRFEWREFSISRVYPYNSRLATNREGSRAHPLPAAIERAITQLAVEDPSEFVEFLRLGESLDNQVVQGLLCRALAKLPPAMAEVGAEYLLADSRRFVLGTMQDQLFDAIQLLRAIAKHISDEQHEELEQRLLAWSHYQDEGDFPEHFDRDNRRDRARLLAGLDQDRTSNETKKTCVGEQAVVAKHERKLESEWEVQTIGSPFTAEDMSRLSDDLLLELFLPLHDGTKDTHPTDFMRGGSIQASQELERLAKMQPARVAELLPKFSPSTHQRPVALAIQGLASTDLMNERLVQLIHDLDSLGFDSLEFRVESANALSLRMDRGLRLGEGHVQRLELWLADTPDDAEIWNRDERASEEPISVLWEHGARDPIPYGRFFILHALTKDRLLREPPDYAGWLRILETHLRRTESAANWRSSATDLRWLRGADARRVTPFLVDLFQRFPQVRDCRAGAVLLAEVLPKIESGKQQELLGGLLASNWSRGPQAYGELLVMAALRGEGNKWGREELDRYLDPAFVTNVAEQVRVGLAFSAARFWRHTATRKAATDLLIRLMAFGSQSVDEAVMDVVLWSEPFPVDESTRTLLSEVSAHPALLASRKAEYLIRHMADLLPHEADLIMNLAEQLVAMRRDELRSIQYSLYAAAPELINISLTVQRLGGAYRSRGLSLFEDLLLLGTYGARDAIDELDHRLKRAPKPSRRRARRA